MRTALGITFALGIVAATALAASGLFFAEPDPFTQNELDTNWEGDRQVPTDDVTSVTAFGRDQVARIGIDSESTQENTFRRTEGIKTRRTEGIKTVGV